MAKDDDEQVMKRIMRLQELLINDKEKFAEFKNDNLQLIQKLTTITRWLELRTRKESTKDERSKQRP